MPYTADKAMRSGNEVFENGDLLQELCQKAAQNKDQNSKPHALGKALRDDVQGFVEYRHQLHMDEINAEGLPAEKGQHFEKSLRQLIKRKCFEKQKNGSGVQHAG